MPRNLFLFTDGTGNAGGKRRSTNVYRLYEAIARGPDQLAFYDDGVGSSDNVLSRALGGAFGLGLTRNVEELYTWLLTHYAHELAGGEERDRVFVFGFSRGAFTARCLAGLVARCGILKRSVWDTLGAAERRRRVRRVVYAYRAANERLCAHWRGDPADFTLARLHFVGVWDTVDAVGMPIDELRPLVDRAFRLLVGRRAYGFDDLELRGVEHARQALSLDDERLTFHPNVWRRNPPDRNPPEERGAREPARPTNPANLRQVWFAGAHSNVGGGYPKDHLARVALDWMMGELEELAEIDGTRVGFLPGRRTEVQQEADAHGRHYEPRTGLAVYYRYSPRRLTRFYDGTHDFWVRWARRLRRLPTVPLPGYGIEVHASVFQRIADGTQGYAPLLLPDGERLRLAVAHTYGDGPFGRGRASVGNGPDHAVRAARTMRRTIHRRVVARQAVYAGFVATTLALLWAGCAAGAPVHEDSPAAAREVLGGWTSGELSALVKDLVPDLAAGLVDAAFAHPAQTLLGLALLATCALTSLRVGGGLAARARRAYEQQP